MSAIKEIMLEYMREHPTATSMEVTRHVHEKQGKPAPSFPISGQYFKQVRSELGIIGRTVKRKKKKGPGRPTGSKNKPKDVPETEYVEAATEKREYKKKKKRLYYTIWECSLEGISSSSERDLTDKLKDFIETLNDTRQTKFEMIEIACPRKIEIRESN